MKYDFQKGNRKCNRIGKSLVIQAIKSSFKLMVLQKKGGDFFFLKKPLEKNCSEPRGRFTRLRELIKRLAKHGQKFPSKVYHNKSSLQRKRILKDRKKIYSPRDEGINSKHQEAECQTRKRERIAFPDSNGRDFRVQP